MYRITVWNPEEPDEPVDTSILEEQLDFCEERGILDEYPDGYYIDIERIPLDRYEHEVRMSDHLFDIEHGYGFDDEYYRTKELLEPEEV